jgi:hypothetical protein
MKRNTIKKMNCSPAVKNKTVSNDTCYTSDILLKIRDEYNKNHSVKEKIISKNPKIVWKTLHERLVKCEKEDCWLKEIKDIKLRKEIDDYIFAPDSPPVWNKNPNEWLSNIDILNVLKQYQKTYKNFLFLGPSPIDFDTHLPERDNKCVEMDICNLSIGEQLKRNKTKIGIIFNLDKHDESGSHWVSLFIDLEEYVIFYFDSAGQSIPKEIEVLKNRIMDQGKELESPIHFKYYDNKGVYHQRGNTECGMYSLFFIITMLTSETEFHKNMTMKDKLKLFRSKRIPDKYVEKYRKIYFNG